MDVGPEQRDPKRVRRADPQRVKRAFPTAWTYTCRRTKEQPQLQEESTCKKNVKSIANCRHELHMKDWLRQEENRRDPRSGRVAAKTSGGNVTRVEDKDRDRGSGQGRKLQQTMLLRTRGGQTETRFHSARGTAMTSEEEGISRIEQSSSSRMTSITRLDASRPRPPQ